MKLMSHQSKFGQNFSLKSSSVQFDYGFIKSHNFNLTDFAHKLVCNYLWHCATFLALLRNQMMEFKCITANSHSEYTDGICPYPKGWTLLSQILCGHLSHMNKRKEQCRDVHFIVVPLIVLSYFIGNIIIMSLIITLILKRLCLHWAVDYLQDKNKLTFATKSFNVPVFYCFAESLH